MKNIFFPFRDLFAKLSLTQRWWHRLSVVLFCAASLAACGTLAFIVYVRVSTYTPNQTVLALHKGRLEYSSAAGIDFDFYPPKEPSVAMVSPDGKRWWIPADQVPGALKAGGMIDKSADSEGPTMDIFDRVALADEVERDGTRVSVPELGIVAFPRFMEKNEVASVCGGLYSEAHRAKRRFVWKQITFSFLALMLFFYASQVIYRIFLYVVFGPSVAC